MGLISVGASLGIAKTPSQSNRANSASRSSSNASSRRPRSSSAQAAPPTNDHSSANCRRPARTSHPQRLKQTNSKADAVPNHKRFNSGYSSSPPPSASPIVPSAPAGASGCNAGGGGLVMQILTVPVTSPSQILMKEVIGARGSRINTICRQSACNITHRSIGESAASTSATSGANSSGNGSHSLSFVVSGDTMKRVVHGMRMMQAHVETMDAQLKRQYQERLERRQKRRQENRSNKRLEKAKSTKSEAPKQPKGHPATQSQGDKQHPIEVNDVTASEQDIQSSPSSIKDMHGASQEQHQQHEPAKGLEEEEEEEEPQEIPVPAHDLLSPRPKKQKISDPADHKEQQTTPKQGQSQSQSPHRIHSRRNGSRRQLFRSVVFAPVDSLVAKTWQQDQRAQVHESQLLQRHLRRQLARQQKQLIDTALRKQCALIACNTLPNVSKCHQVQTLGEVLHHEQEQLNLQLQQINDRVGESRKRKWSVFGRKGRVKRPTFASVGASSHAFVGQPSPEAAVHRPRVVKTDQLVKRIKELYNHLEFASAPQGREVPKHQDEGKHDMNCVPVLEGVKSLVWVPKHLLRFLAGQRQYFYLEPFVLAGSGHRQQCFELPRSDRIQLVRDVINKESTIKQLVSWTKSWGDSLSQHTLNMKWPKLLTELTSLNDSIMLFHFLGLHVNHQLQHKINKKKARADGSSSFHQIDLLFQSDMCGSTSNVHTRKKQPRESENPESPGLSRVIGSKTLLKQMLAPLREFGLHENPFDLTHEDTEAGFDLILPLTLEKETLACCPELFVHVLEWQDDQDIPEEILDEAIGMREFDKQIVKGAEGLRSVFMMHLIAQLRGAMLAYETEYLHLLQILEIWGNLRNVSLEKNEEEDSKDKDCTGEVDDEGECDRSVLKSINELKRLTAELMAIQVQVLLVKWAWTFLENRSKWNGLLWRTKMRIQRKTKGSERLSCNRFTCLQDALHVWHQVQLKYHALDFRVDQQQINHKTNEFKPTKKEMEQHKWKWTSDAKAMQWPWSEDFTTQATTSMERSLAQTETSLKHALEASVELLSEASMFRLQVLSGQMKEETNQLKAIQEQVEQILRQERERVKAEAQEAERQEQKAQVTSTADGVANLESSPTVIPAVSLASNESKMPFVEPSISISIPTADPIKATASESVGTPLATQPMETLPNAPSSISSSFKPTMPEVFNTTINTPATVLSGTLSRAQTASHAFSPTSTPSPLPMQPVKTVPPTTSTPALSVIPSQPSTLPNHLPEFVLPAMSQVPTDSPSDQVFPTPVSRAPPAVCTMPMSTQAPVQSSTIPKCVPVTQAAGVVVAATPSSTTAPAPRTSGLVQIVQPVRPIVSTPIPSAPQPAPVVSKAMTPQPPVSVAESLPAKPSEVQVDLAGADPQRILSEAIASNPLSAPATVTADPASKVPVKSVNQVGNQTRSLKDISSSAAAIKAAPQAPRVTSARLSTPSPPSTRSPSATPTSTPTPTPIPIPAPSSTPTSTSVSPSTSTQAPAPTPAQSPPPMSGTCSTQWRRPDPSHSVRARVLPASFHPTGTLQSPPTCFIPAPVKGVADPLRKGCIGCRDLRRRCIVCEHCCTHCQCLRCSCRECQRNRETNRRSATSPTPTSSTTSQANSVQGDGFVMHNAFSHAREQPGISAEELQRQRQLFEQEQIFRAARAKMKVQMRSNMVPGGSTKGSGGGIRVYLLNNTTLWQPERIFHAWHNRNSLAVLGLLSHGETTAQVNMSSSLRLSEQLIKSQYRKLALKLHPDKTQRGKEEEENQAAEAFVIVNHAYKSALQELAKSSSSADLAG